MGSGDTALAMYSEMKIVEAPPSNYVVEFSVTPLPCCHKTLLKFEHKYISEEYFDSMFDWVLTRCGPEPRLGIIKAS